MVALHERGFFNRPRGGQVDADVGHGHGDLVRKKSSIVLTMVSFSYIF
jgi:hypothetical protein